MRPDIREEVVGRWPSILAAIGIDRDLLDGKHRPCPVCGGKDRFRFDDKEGRGTHFCSHCGAGDGFDLVAKLKGGLDFAGVVNAVREVIGSAVPTPVKKVATDDEKRAKINRIWTEAQPVKDGDPVSLYLDARGIGFRTREIRCHPALESWEGKILEGVFPALVARFWNRNGSPVAIQRIYLTIDGNKAPIACAKKTLACARIEGGAVRLFQVSEALGIAEGIETAISAHKLFGGPVWSCLSDSGVATFQPPEGVKRVIIYGDNDTSAAGQAAAWACAKRLIAKGIEAEVQLPLIMGTDWNDVLRTGL